MPSTKRSSGNSRINGRQSTLSFNHRVTKSLPKSAKDLDSKPVKQSPLATHVSSIKLEEPASNEERAIKDEFEEKPIKDEFEEEPQVAQPEPKVEPEKSEAELRAQKITDQQINRYWRGLENERRAKRVHQEDLALAEKVLRYWDVSSQYGPCVGMDRLKRWKRAEKLGLNPPLEVLAVLQKEETKGTKGIENTHMDEILNSTAIGAI
ncbi:DNA polymerase delta, subunit 4-domain-containing protein [Annulohypoxylon maeteangense]|uniref:DNA polymerase delta, subunit 4-domain-containing protein n=1 Tax=Annulohypoxylon maeteangense TaxID=1927788 RepID=UPI0020085EAD|nr:DNA polymerase delta, subunit 4-domain-containing protein [Annulohypoxylon maeteangense]KAI0884996.1 DNA polymerase delta, subunit 4-domain-containing protein [Annulohypoxylon maeteangense]